MGQNHSINEKEFAGMLQTMDVAPSPSPSQETQSVLVSWTQGGKDVYVTGTFNDWKQRIPLNKSEQGTITHFRIDTRLHYHDTNASRNSSFEIYCR